MHGLLATFAALATLATVCSAATDPSGTSFAARAKELTVETGEVLQDPDEDQLRSALLSLDGRRNKFAILSLVDEPLTYLQVYLDVDSPGPILEYQEGSIDRHFQAVRPELSREDVVRVFQSYRRDDPEWARCCTWQRIPPAELESADDPP